MISKIAMALFILFLILVILRYINEKLRRFFNKKRRILIDVVLVLIIGILWGKYRIDPVKASYTSDMILIWDEEYGGKTIDPATFEKTEQQGNAHEDIEDIEAEDKDVYDEEVVVGKEIIETEKDLYEVLRIFGEYRFENYVKKEDLNYFQEKCEEYFESRNLEEVCNLSEEEEKVIQDRIKSYDQALASHESLLSEEHMQNSNDRWEMFVRDGNLGMLEQSAVSAEAAVQEEEVDEEFSREDFYQFIRVTVDRFRLRLDYNMDNCASGEKSDLQYRIGKVLYKPVANLNIEERQNKYYSLCTVYSILKEACNNSKEDSLYAVETAYYYFLVCVEVIKNMEDVPEEVKEEMIKAHDLFENRGKCHSGNRTYKKYRDSAEKIRYEMEKDVVR